MRSKPFHHYIVMISVTVLLVGATHASGPSGTAFTYQGQLKQTGAPVNQACDFQYSLWDAESNGAQVGTTLDRPGVSVVHGLFQTLLDFGDAAFDGGLRWLQVSVRCPVWDGMGTEPTFTVLTPRSFIAPSPYAIHALTGNQGGNFSLPIDATHNGNDETAFSIKENGLGSAAAFSIDNPDSYWSAGFATSNGTAPALHATQSRGEVVAQFENTVLNNSVPTLLVISNGTGAAIQGTTRPGMDGSGVIGYSDGDGNGVQGSVGGSGNAIQGKVTNNFGRAAYFQSTSGGNGNDAVLIEASGAATSKALRVRSTGSGDAGYFEIQNPRSDGEVLEAHTNGTGNGVAVFHTGSLGRAGYFLHEGASNTFPAIEVLTRSVGRGAHIEIDNTANSSAAIYAKTDGDGAAIDAETFGHGPAAEFSINNSNSSNNALYVTTIGTGRAALFQANNAATTVPAVQITTLGSGPALHVSGDVEVNGNVSMGYEMVQVDGEAQYMVALCPSGKRVLGGGCWCGVDLIRTSFPANADGDFDTVGWWCACGDVGFHHAFAICANIR